MSGHSKWSTIKRKKGANDVKKGQLFTKLSKIITLAAMEGEGPSLRLAVERARAENMPKENIARAINKARGPDASSLREVVYEGFAPGGVSLIIIAHTDNSNRTHAEIKNTLEKRGGKLGAINSALYLFDESYRPKFIISIDDTARRSIEQLIEALEQLDDVDKVYTNYGEKTVSV